MSEFKTVVNDLFYSNGFECDKLFYNDEIFYCIEDVLTCLNCDKDNNDVKKILSKVNKNNKFTIEELEEKYSSWEYLKYGAELISSQDQDELKYIYINKTALCELFNSFKKPEAKPFKDFIFRILFPALDKIYKEKIIKMQKKFIKFENDIQEPKLELQHLWMTLKKENDMLLDDNEKLLEYIKMLEDDYILDNGHEYGMYKKFFVKTCMFLILKLITLL